MRMGFSVSKTMLAIGVGMLASLIGWPHDTAHAGETVTCGWCYEFQDGAGNWFHGFFDEEGDECGWPQPDVPDEELGGEMKCSRCGGLSTCHTSWGSASGTCHLDCGPGGGNLARVYATVSEGLRLQELSSIVAAISDKSGAYSVEYIPDGGRLEIVADCAPVAVATFPVPMALRGSIEELLAESGSRSEVGDR